MFSHLSDIKSKKEIRKVVYKRFQTSSKKIKTSFEHKFDCEDLLFCALTHSSFYSTLNKNKVQLKSKLKFKSDQSYQNRKRSLEAERFDCLRILGRSVIGFILSSHLYFLFSESSENELTNFKALISNKIVLTRLSIKCVEKIRNLIKYMPNQNFETVCLQVFEALFGAMYLDGGLSSCRRIFSQVLFDFLTQKFDEKDYNSNKSLKDFSNFPILQKFQLAPRHHEFKSSELSKNKKELSNECKNFQVEFQNQFDKIFETTKIQINCFDLFKLAFTHRSFITSKIKKTNSLICLSNNERMEFLGDSIFDLIVASRLCLNDCLEFNENDFCNRKTHLVSNQTLSKIGRHFGFDDIMLKMSLGSQYKYITEPIKISDKTVADCVEAFIGAIYLDNDLKSCYLIVDKLFNGFYNENIQNKANIITDTNYKLKLQKIAHNQCKKRRLSECENPEYIIKPGFHINRDLNEQGVRRDEGFTVEAQFRNNLLASSFNKHKNIALLECSRIACENFSKNIF